jgi:hypothetical protein
MELLNYDISELMITYLDDVSKNKLMLSKVINVELEYKIMIELVDELSNLKNKMKNNYFINKELYHDNFENNSFYVDCGVCNCLFIDGDCQCVCSNCGINQCTDCGEMKQCPEIHKQNRSSKLCKKCYDNNQLCSYCQ